MTKSERTRLALREAALRHFVEHGFEAANVPAIAAEVGVTERTFYRHFATKDEVLFGDITGRLMWLPAALRQRPEDEDLIRSVLAALGSAPIDPQVMAEIARLRQQLLSPERIERAFRDAQGVMARQLRSFLEERGDGALLAAVRAEAVTGAVFAALAVWTESSESPDLARLLTLTEEGLLQVRPALGRRAGPSPS